MVIDGELCNTRSGKKFETLNSAKPDTGGTVGKALALHSDGDKISFAGSTDVGKLMMVYAGESNLKRVTVETGGKSPQKLSAADFNHRRVMCVQLAEQDRVIHHAPTASHPRRSRYCGMAETTTGAT